MEAKPTIELFVPGRLCLFGEHSDWAAEFGVHNGHCLVIGTDQGLHAAARACDEFVVTSATSSNTLRLPWRVDALRRAACDQDEFFRYAAGVACVVMCERHAVPAGLELTLGAMDLPLKKGVASSAAVCMLVAKAFDAAYSLHLFPHELMEAAYLGEQLTASRCGRMDQACIYGKTPVLLTFAGQSRPRVEPLFPRQPVEMLFVDLAGEKDTVAILTDLRRAYAGSPSLRTALGPGNERIVRHAHAALEAGDAEQLGQWMTHAQRLFDAQVAPHSPHLASPLLHAVLNLPGLERWTTGGKGVGSQGDGTAQFVARDAACRTAAITHIARHFPAMRCFPLTIPARQ
jgi:galactokinase